MCITITLVFFLFGEVTTISISELAKLVEKDDDCESLSADLEAMSCLFRFTLTSKVHAGSYTSHLNETSLWSNAMDAA